MGNSNLQDAAADTPEQAHARAKLQRNETRALTDPETFLVGRVSEQAATHGERVTQVHGLFTAGRKAHGLE